ncbi:PREDICTED: xanthine dehydrogenase/oxidase-like [Amphimedon queenslandica]|uniref:xanthine dehydrogenase n=1 Tax=Amphimedon queenslandica TaxID=400682 RepID=A0A1X7VNF9_AMPQE|nr:PREDICTED: xanthine dehydrogenase/oxidase-like [Amphimedon queenslandica]|eukprot:XP_019862049.1 PREDICTED: xanthine dehydrogenase/oxidase-like [Amphimedon queenslandica]
MDGVERASCIRFFVNGVEVIVNDPDPEMTLLTYLRRYLKLKATVDTKSGCCKDEAVVTFGLTGTKLGCGEGGCGACTVMVSKYDGSKDTIKHYTVNACLAPLCSMDGLSVITVEGIGNSKNLHPCQERIAKAHGSQCGFCTPGFVMSMYTLLRNNPSPTQEEMEHAFEGNLCRCTGYRPILDGYRTFCSDCKCKGDGKEGGKSKEADHKLFDATKFKPYDPSQEIIFPPGLKAENRPPLSLEIKFNDVSWYRPVSLKELLELRDKFPHYRDSDKPKYRLVMGNTEIEIERRLKGFKYDVLICPSHVPELLELTLEEEGLVVGASVTLTDLKDYITNLLTTQPPHTTGVLQALLNMLKWFAGPQLRNVSSFGGNIANASPISDLNPVLLASGATLNFASIKGERILKMNEEDFFTGYRTTTMKENEILKSVKIPLTKKGEHVMSFKQSRRREDDIAIVNSCFFVSLDDDLKVRDCRLAYGGMSFKTIMATKTQKELIGRKWDGELLQCALESLADELVLPPEVPGGMPDYRLSLALSFFYKFYLFVLQQYDPQSITPTKASATQPFSKPVSRGSQGFKKLPNSGNNKIGQPEMHLSAIIQATGEAVYTDDLPHYDNELYAGLVLSKEPHAEFTIDTSQIKDIDDVYFVCAQDVPGHNDDTGVFGDEEVFREKTVTSIGQIIGIVLAKNKEEAQKYVKKVDVNYTPLEAVLTIEDAIEKEQYYDISKHELSTGDVKKAMSEAEYTIEGSMRTGGQEHFYLETNVCIAIPKRENGEIEIIATTQCTSETQHWAAKALGVPANRIVAKVKRIGGGFGGKETRFSPLTTTIAVAANKVGRPVRIMLDRDEDMKYSGNRHPYKGEYRIGFTKEGKLTALEMELYSNAGYSFDLSLPVLERAVTHATNAYTVPNAFINGQLCKTNLPSNTAFRGFGGPQGMMMMEDAMDRIAYTLKMDPVIVREINLVKEGDETVYGYTLTDCHMRKAWKKLLEESQYYQRMEAIKEFNSQNEWVKRGMAIVPTKYGIAFGLKLLNQGGALVLVYKDGSVLLSHGGMEMGQGLHTKMIQVCSRVLDIPIDMIHLIDCSTDKVPNNSPTAASASSDLYGMAVKDACEQIKERLQPYKEKKPEAGWKNWVISAYVDRVNLSAQGFYATDLEGMNWETGKGQPYNYYCYGVGCTEVEIDTLTGDFKVLRSDLLMDVGDSLNPAIDIGQVEGAFTQGLGLFTMEEVVYLKNGKLFTTGPGAYKIPSCNDIPIELNVTLMDSTPNPRAIFNSKAVGEPPLFLAGSVFFAIKDAIRSARISRGHHPVFDLWAPATAERIRLACKDQFTEMAEEKMKNKYPGEEERSKRWNVVP